MKLIQLQNPQFQATWQKVLNAKLSAKGIWKVKRMAKWLEKELTLIEETRKELALKYCIVDENGPVLNDTKHFTFEEGKMGEFTEEYVKLLQNDLEIKVRFNFDELDGAELTGADLIALDDLIVEPTEEA